jgi:mRNA-degrading endonuclease RelE of RelBE toxin-antitoxin system
VVGDYRVVFKIAASGVSILTILHRKEVYEEALARVGWRP